MKKASWAEVSKLQDRSGLWTTRALKASTKGDCNRAGRLKIKALQLSVQAENMKKKLRSEETL